MTYTVGHLFAGAGGGALGFRRAGFESAFAVDSWDAACRAHEYLTGDKATCADLGKIEPSDLRALSPEAPDVLFTSPPCKGFSGCLPAARSETPHYLALNSLAFRGVWLAMEAWPRPPKLVLLENVPRIQSRGREWLDRIAAMLRGYGYAVSESTHDCGVLGGLAQHRRRFLLVARHIEQVPAFLRVPSSRRVRGIGEVLGELPVPLLGSTEGGPMHRLPKLSALNWIRLALIPAGGDWRDIPEAVRLPGRDARQNGPYGVEPWEGPAHAVLAHTTARDTWGSVADPRVDAIPSRHAGALGVEGWGDAAHTVTGQHGRRGWDSVADPRLVERGDPSTDGQARHKGKLGVESWNDPSHTIIGAASPGHGRGAVVADPRVGCVRRDGGHGVKGWGQPSAPVIGHPSIDNFPAQVADPRLGCTPGQTGHLGVQGWASPSHTIRAHFSVQNSAASVADPRHTQKTEGRPRPAEGPWLQLGSDGVHSIEGPPIDIESKRPIHLVIRAADGTWHRPMTTLELAALQSFPTRIRGEWLDFGASQAVARELIGNAVPPDAAEAIARSCGATLDAAGDGVWTLDARAIWVRKEQEARTDG